MSRALRASVFLVIISTFLSPFTRELFVGDETKYAQVVREMRAGAFFLPTLGGEPFTHKPPLHFWIVDLLTYPLSVYSLWAFVLPSLIAFCFLLWLIWRMEGPLAAFVCGTSLMMWGSAQTARMDVGFTALIVLAAWLFQRFLHGERRALVGAGVSLGIATLIKGPMAPVIGIFLLLFEWLRRKRLPRGQYALAFLAMAIIPLLWFVPAMLMGGGGYTHEVLVKQTAGRAVGAWVHKAAPWFYVVHAPGDLFPWFLLLVVALVATWRRRDEPSRFYLNWILAVLVPYSLMSSKLDVYMIAIIPPAALLIARFAAVDDLWSRWGRIANLAAIAVLFAVGISALFIPASAVKGPESALVHLLVVKMFFAVLALSAAAGLIVALRTRSVTMSTIAAGAVPLAAAVYAALFLMPLANELASPRPLIQALERMNVPPENVALYTSPHLWARDMPPSFERVRYVSAESLRGRSTEVIVTSRKHAAEISGPLRGYRPVATVRMIGKWFDVYRR